ALDEQRNQERATAGAQLATMVASGTPLPTYERPPTFPPGPSPEVGEHGCGEGNRDFIYGTCWTLQGNDEYLYINTIAPKNDPAQGMIRVITSTLDTQILGDWAYYPTPSR